MQECGCPCHQGTTLEKQLMASVILAPRKSEGPSYEASGNGVGLTVSKILLLKPTCVFMPAGPVVVPALPAAARSSAEKVLWEGAEGQAGR